MRKITLLLLSLSLNLILTYSLGAAYRDPVWSDNGMAATPHPAATAAACEILEQGGNAIDAAVAAAYALSVVEQYHSGLGGGEFMLIRIAETDEIISLDARETAPLNAMPDMYLDPATGEAFTNKSSRGGLAAGVPGSVAGRIALIKKYGRLKHSQVVAPAIELAEDGFELDRIYASRIDRYQDNFVENKVAASVFLPKGKPLGRGELLVQPQLAKTLKSIAKSGNDYFYHGEGAKQIASAVQAAGGIIEERDLAEYKLQWREPIHFKYRGYDIFSMPPPSSGGVCLAQILNILEGYPLDFLEPTSSEYYHLFATACELSFADRAKWLGDPGYNVLPVAGMASKAYATELRTVIDRNYRNPVSEAGDPWQYSDDDTHTSHLSVVDADGNMCAITTSVNTSFGSLVFIPEMGIFMNSTMDDFAIEPGNPNEWGLLGSEVNSVAPGKRPLSSMSPTLVLKDDKPFLCIGSVGGPRIITSIAQIILNVVDHDMDIQQAIDMPRIHMQWRPDKLYIERDVPQVVVSQLRQMGWTVDFGRNWSLSQGILIDNEKGWYFGASDARGVGTADSPKKR
ncbi:gamma-glutamyltransferase [Calditrichota bacterium]